LSLANQIFLPGAAPFDPAIIAVLFVVVWIAPSIVPFLSDYTWWLRAGAVLVSAAALAALLPHAPSTQQVPFAIAILFLLLWIGPGFVPVLEDYVWWIRGGVLIVAVIAMAVFLPYARRSLIAAIPTLFLIIAISFFLMRVAPGGPFNLERPLDPTVMENLNRTFHLNEPLWKQFTLYLGNLVTGDLGPSFIYRDFSVNELFANGLPVSLQVGGAALALALLLGTTLGSIAALNQNGFVDYGVVTLATFGLTIPTFVTAPLLSLIFGVWLGWLPAGGWGGGALENMILPVVTLMLPQLAIVTRLTRGSMIEALRSNHVRTARAYGLNHWSVVAKHALRSAVLPVISYSGPAAAALLTGSVVVETIFGIPGIGRYFVQSALNRDYTVVMGTVVVVAVFIIIFNLIVDLLYAVVDPRVRYQ
jgi:oligopeptide transport system permease protein